MMTETVTNQAAWQKAPGQPLRIGVRGLTLSGTKTHVKQLWLRKTKGSGEDPLVC
ncbi:hypothetical protein YW72_001903 [Salmonella enterica subsp. enterica]|nr:hypothetical protein [Salmonella enterica subsp. enterica]EDU9707903.1 hypothetical protein [Salmonella enterica]